MINNLVKNILLNVLNGLIKNIDSNDINEN